ncbi:LTA synthase family protein [Chakrabartyella piscis]|uniref:LTA synthase family protein n=1 Tax=Chakrabartyella piscis TaxID=2918914 RepID=UPI002958D8BF|nr:LTA synthase family protein [Chakrabartyella piscis]
MEENEEVIQEPMQETTNTNKPTLVLGHLLVSILFVVIASYAISGILMNFIPTDATTLISNYKSFAMVGFLNTLPIITTMFVLYCIGGKRVFACLLTALLFAVAAAIHVVKMTLRNEPLLPTDTSLVNEAITIVKTYPKYLLVLIGVGLVVLLVLLVFIYRGCKEKRLPIWLRGICCLLMILVFSCSKSLYKDEDLYDSFPINTITSGINQQYDARGLVYSFFHQLFVENTLIPETYDLPTFSSLDALPQIDSEQELPHIIMIMGEAFSDLTDNPHLDYSNTRDPLQEFKAMQTSDNGFGGKIVVPGYGGGTANTEFDVLTGFSTSLLNRPLASYEYIETPTDALPRRLQAIGYDTLAIHPGYEWFYDRNLAYPRLGFEAAYFLEDSFDLATQGIGGYVNETATMDKIIETFEEHLATTDAPLFSFTVTIQNHGPYESRFGPIDELFTSDVNLTSFEYDLLNQYSKGITDADLQLARLRDYVAELEEPVVIVYYGDHLPCFTNGKEFFDILDYPIDPNGNYTEQLAMYEVPFVVWSNDAAMELANIKENAENSNLPEDGIISAHYLTPLLTEVLQLDGLSPYFDYAYDLLGSLPIATKNIYMEADGTYSSRMPEAALEELNFFLSWQHYKTTDEVIDAVDDLDIIPEPIPIAEPVVEEVYIPEEAIVLEPEEPIEEMPITTDEDIIIEETHLEENILEENTTSDTVDSEDEIDMPVDSNYIEESPEEELMYEEEILYIEEITTDTTEVSSELTIAPDGITENNDIPDEIHIE